MAKQSAALLLSNYNHDSHTQNLLAGRTFRPVLTGMLL
jgi:hypothetical protein